MKIIKPVPGHPGYGVDASGTVYGKTGKILRLFAGVGGYLRFTTYESGRWQQVSVHVKVCEAFHGPRPFGHHAAHSNGVRTDNRASNLSWKTASDNEADKLEHGVRARGETHGMRKLTENQVREIRADAHLSRRVLAQRYGVAVRTIESVIRREHWRHVQ